ncbi:ECF transporter S component [Anaerococcus sp. NML200537]|uniref:ECF transporter S component n=1 Tax=Anaerococcus sp. NML200537 TaxID=2954485 RepID=UPI0022385FE7|nr:ECF transporter S component [Anaerococcus sp. NML200537]MCW6701644.1 ECF transporter S component [Anaerococcus sp. NML200537]
MKFDTRNLTSVGILGAIVIMLGLTPLGFLPLGVLTVTTLHIPVIIAGILEGPLVGGLVGLIFGLFSIFNAITRPGPISFVFYNPLISIIPRILIGVVTGLVYRALKNKDNSKLRLFMNVFWSVVAIVLAVVSLKSFVGDVKLVNKIFSLVFLILAIVMLYLSVKNKKANFAIAVSSFMGTLTNSGLVLGLIYLIYAKSYAEAIGISPDLAMNAIFSAFITNAIPEAIVAILIASAVVTSLSKRRK